MRPQTTSPRDPQQQEATLRNLETKYEDPEYQIGRLRTASTPMQLRGRERKAVIIFYNSFVDFLKMYRVPIKIFDVLQVSKLDSTQEMLYPSDLQHEHNAYIRERYSAAIYARLEEDGILDPNEQMYQGLLQMYNSTRDGYSLLQAILAATLVVASKNVGVLNTPPIALPGSNPYEYAVQLQEFYRLQHHNGRNYPPQEQALMYLQGMQRSEAYAGAAAQLIHELEQMAPTRTSQPAPIEVYIPTSAGHTGNETRTFRNRTRLLDIGTAERDTYGYSGWYG